MRPKRKAAAVLAIIAAAVLAAGAGGTRPGHEMPPDGYFGSGHDQGLEISLAGAA